MKKDVDVYLDAISVGIKKTKKTQLETFAAGFLGGAFIALGGLGYLSAAAYIGPSSVGKLIGAFLFPVGLLLIILTGAELFTGNNLMSLAAIHGDVSAKKVGINWLQIFVYNWIGAAFIGLLFHLGEYDKGDMFTLLEKMSHTKTELSFISAFARGILCNLLVAIAVWISYASERTSGKAILIWMPIALFVFSGYEHCVANMLYFSLAKMAGVDLTLSGVVANMIPVTLGNIVGGGVILPLAYYGMFKNKIRKKI